MSDAPPLSRVERWERRAEIPLLMLAVAFLVAYAWPVLDSSVDRDLRSLLAVVSLTVWVVFAADFAVRLVLAEQRLRYARRNWFDVALIVLPMLRPLRLLRLVVLLRVLNRSATSNLAGRASTYAVGGSLMAVGLGAIAVLDAEQGAPDANITTFGDALWWAVTTVTTVGYGDRFPVTTEGRLIAVVLMVVGISLIGIVTASVAAWFVTTVVEDEAEQRAEQSDPR